MDGDLKWIVIAIVVIFFLSRLLDNAGLTTTSASTIKTPAQTKIYTTQNQIITTKVLDAYGNIVEIRENKY